MGKNPNRTAPAHTSGTDPATLAKELREYIAKLKTDFETMKKTVKAIVERLTRDGTMREEEVLTIDTLGAEFKTGGSQPERVSRLLKSDKNHPPEIKDLQGEAFSLLFDIYEYLTTSEDILLLASSCHLIEIFENFEGGDEAGEGSETDEAGKTTGGVDARKKRLDN